MKDANIQGYYTNHSLRATATTRMYDAQLDEATIMSRTGHHSVDGVRAYKRTTTVSQELSSAILNGVTSGDAKEETITPREAKEENATVVREGTTMPREAKEENAGKYPQMDFGNATNFTINFNFNTK